MQHRILVVDGSFKDRYNDSETYWAISVCDCGWTSGMQQYGGHGGGSQVAGNVVQSYGWHMDSVNKNEVDIDEYRRLVIEILDDILLRRAELKA